jgi:hypothetical protein
MHCAKCCTIFLKFLPLHPCCTANFFHTNSYTTFTSLLMLISHISCLFKLCSNPVDSVSQWCNMNRKLSMMVSLHSNVRITREVKGFDDTFLSIIYVYDVILLFSSVLPVATSRLPKCVEQSVKQQHSVTMKLFRF